MKNFELNSYREKPICDGHIHSHIKLPIKDSVEIYKKVINHFNYQKFAIQALPSYSVINNFEGLYYKSVFDNAYTNVGLIHETEESYLEQAEKLYRMGCDGFKMLEGKPDYRKKLDKPLDHPSFDEFYAFVEEKRLPLLLHYGDPREFWDKDKIPKWALERGWLYDATFTHFDEGQKEVERVLCKFPKLHLVLAHFFFVSDDYDYAVNFMEKWENVCFDITLGTEMYVNFNNDSRWRDFFIKYQDRILYGTDIYNWEQGDSTVEERYAHAVNLIRSFLEKKEPFSDKWTGRKFEKPFGLPSEVLDKIYSKNFIRLYGEKPRALNKPLLKDACKSVNFCGVDETGRENITYIIENI